VRRLAMLAVVALLPVTGCKQPTSTPVARVEPLKTLPLGTQYQVLATGDGKVATKGRHVSVHYVGTFGDGTQFDNSYKRGTPMTFRLGSGLVIKGWDEGVEGMREGEKRRLVIPSKLAYGPSGNPPTIPPNATLTFEVKLVEVR